MDGWRHDAGERISDAMWLNLTMLVMGSTNKIPSKHAFAHFQTITWPMQKIPKLVGFVMVF